jgi:MoaA/NifB/PqqE/SkfB family radical SAM enzyme
MYKIGNLRTSVGLSTFCNAKCPQCHRTNPRGLDKMPWLPLVNWDFAGFKKAFPPEKMKLFAEIQICGTWGDPVMNKDIAEICKYIASYDSILIGLNTNGSIRDEEWWFELGAACGSALEVCFTIDGHTQESHELYRRNTSLQKILNNMASLSYTLARIKVMTIRFKHNEPYLKDIQELVKAHGAQGWTGVVSNRFNMRGMDEVWSGYQPKFDYIYKGKLYTLEEVPDLSEPYLKVWFGPGGATKWNDRNQKKYGVDAVEYRLKQRLDTNKNAAVDEWGEVTYGMGWQQE